jgi:3'-5' exoribonuclease
VATAAHRCERARFRQWLQDGSPVTAIAALEPGRPVEGVYAVRRKERRLTRAGKPFLAVTLTDSTGAIPAVLFDEVDFFAAQFEEGDRVRVAGRVVEHAGRAQITLSHVRSAAEEAAAEDLLPRSHRDPDELFGFVVHLADEIAEPGLRRVLGALLGDDDLARAWRTVPCTRSGHHAYMGGLLEHTVGVASLCQTLTQWHPRLDSDLLLAAALVHDIGYTRTYRMGATFELTDEGRLLGHLALGHEIVAGATERAGLAPDRRLALLHAVAWHHGPPAGQAPGAASPEALALWRTNSLETAVKARMEGPGPGSE